MSKKILDFSTISGETVKKYEGIKKYIATGDITNNKISSYTEVDYSNKPSRANQIAKIGEVLFAKMKDTIKVITINNKNSEYIYSTGFYIIKPKENVLTDYLYWLFNSPKFNIDKDKYCKGATQKALNNEGLSKIEIKELPNIEIQEKIVCKLNKVAEILNKKQEQLNALDELIKSQFVEMFGDPNIVKSNEKTELKTIMINANNGMARRGNDSDGSIVLRLIELQRNYIDYSNVNKIILKDNEKKKYLLEEGDILFARVNGNPDNVGRCAYYKDIGEEVYHNDHIIRVKFDLHKINPIYLCTLLNDEYGRKEFKNKIKTSAGQYTISQDGIEKVKIPLPQIELQNKFAEFVNEIDKQKFEIENSLKEMQGLYESLMEKYFG